MDLPAPGAPTGSSGPAILSVAAHRPQEVAQRLCETATGRAWRRARAGGVWQSWRREVGQADLLGPVALSDGLPSGAVFETGTTPSGTYLRLADGTQIAWRDEALFARVSTERLEHVWGLPAPFSETPQATATLPGAESAYAGLAPGRIGWLMQETGSASATPRLPRVAGSSGFAAGAQVAGLRLLAIGR